jgi:hypothetical protein
MPRRVDEVSVASMAEAWDAIAADALDVRSREIEESGGGEDYRKG